MFEFRFSTRTAMASISFMFGTNCCAPELLTELDRLRFSPGNSDKEFNGLKAQMIRHASLDVRMFKTCEAKMERWSGGDLFWRPDCDKIPCCL